MLIQNFNAPAITTRSLNDVPDLTIMRSDKLTVIHPGAITSEQHGDLVVDYMVTPTAYNEGQLIVSADVISMRRLAFTSLDLDIAAVDQEGRLSRVANGNARILIDVNGVVVRHVVDVSTNTPSTSLVSQRYAEGTVGRDATDAIETRISGKTMAANGRLYSAQDHGNHSFIRNPNFWAADIDLTCISPSNSRNWNRRAGVLIAAEDSEGNPLRRFALVAAHFPLLAGDTIYFVTAENETIGRKIIKASRHPGYAVDGAY